MIERFNGRIADVLATTRFDSSQSLAETLTRYVRIYNPYIPQKALGHIAPIQTMKNGYNKRPDLFQKRVYNLTGFDTDPTPPQRLQPLALEGLIGLFPPPQSRQNIGACPGRIVL